MALSVFSMPAKRSNPSTEELKELITRFPAAVYVSAYPTYYSLQGVTS